MEGKYKVLCINDYRKDMYAIYHNPTFKKGNIYICKYFKNIDEDYYSIRLIDDTGDELLEANEEALMVLKNFQEIEEDFNLLYYKKKINIFKIIINKFTKIKFEDKYKKIKYKYKDIGENLFKKIYEVISAIHTIEESEFYIYHQDKIKYILDSLIEMYKVSNEDDFDKHIKDCIQLLDKIKEAIAIAENKVKEQDDKNKKQIMIEYSRKKQELFKMWDTELSDLWEVK
jgi:hypothetical protein